MNAQLTGRLSSLVPRPATLTPLAGDVTLTGSIAWQQGAEAAGELLAGYLADGGLRPRPAPWDDPPPPGAVTLALDATDRAAGEEAYTLLIDAGRARVTARTVTGLRHGVQTLRQLAGARGEAERWRLPGVAIADAPRLSWRGALLDVGRWFLPLADLRRYIDVFAAHKLTTLHLHLTDDQGWRFESLRYPGLTQVGAWRRESPLGHQRDGRHDGRPHGGYYTQAELRELVAFARRRGIEIMPEVDLPGHTTAAIAAYPELGNTDVSVVREVSTSWGVHTTVLNPQESTTTFVRDVLDEVMDVFPSQYIHIGGDECPTVEWERSPAARRRAGELGLAGAQELQSWFTAQMAAVVTHRGRVPVVWDEAADAATLQRDVVVMAWRDAAPGVNAAHRGHPVIMTPQQAVYLDHHACTEPDRPLAHDGLTTLRDVYAFDAVPAAEAPDVAARILGTQAQIWTEYLPSAAHIDALAFPRLCAVADRAWATSTADYGDFLQRLRGHLPRLTDQGVAISPERMWKLT